MMASKYTDLRNALSETILGVPWDSSSTLPESQRISHLAQLTRDYGMGDVDIDTLTNAFRGTGFDVRRWVLENFDLSDE